MKSTITFFIQNWMFNFLMLSSWRNSKIRESMPKLSNISRKKPLNTEKVKNI